jgi:hypothetical protein
LIGPKDINECDFYSNIEGKALMKTIESNLNLLGKGPEEVDCVQE